jgi:hypothetical protein
MLRIKMRAVRPTESLLYKKKAPYQGQTDIDVHGHGYLLVRRTTKGGSLAELRAFSGSRDHLKKY